MAIKLKQYPNRMQGGLMICTPDAPAAVSPAHLCLHAPPAHNACLQRGYGLGISDPDAAELVISFTVAQDSRVYVCADRQMAQSGQAPTWLQARGWQVVTDTVAMIADEMFDYFVIYTLPDVVPRDEL